MNGAETLADIRRINQEIAAIELRDALGIRGLLPANLEVAIKCIPLLDVAPEAEARRRAPRVLRRVVRRQREHVSRKQWFDWLLAEFPEAQ